MTTPLASSPEPSGPPTEPTRGRPFPSVAILLIPAIGCLVIALFPMGGGERRLALLPLLALFALGGSLVAGSVVGIRLSRSLVTQPGWRPVAAVGFTLLCAVASLCACFGGCVGGAAISGN